jgi:hypothetical protein
MNVAPVASIESLAQVFKIAAGVAQILFAVYVILARGVTRLHLAFGVAFAANGLAYAIFNLIPPRLRVERPLIVGAWGASNWIAALALVLFAIGFARSGSRARWQTLLLPAATGGALVVAQAFAFHGRVNLVSFGGLAIGAAQALLLVLLAVSFSRFPSADRPSVALLAGALSCDLAIHTGAALISPEVRVVSKAASLGAVLLFLSVWMWNARASGREDFAKARNACFFVLAVLLAGIGARAAVGSYRAFQEWGFVGAARLLAVGMLLYGVHASSLFASPRAPNSKRGPPGRCSSDRPDDPQLAKSNIDRDRH